jgi:hypothetical protein
MAQIHGAVMSADEIIKHIPEIASVTKVAIGAVPFTAIVKRMVGPAADEVAQMWADKVKLWRFERQASCVKKAETMLQDAGITPHTVSPKILFPLLEGASFEDNEDLHDMWAALLANAASPEKSGKIRPVFIAILRRMAPDEATLLNWMVENLVVGRRSPFKPIELDDLAHIYRELLQIDKQESDFRICLYSLTATDLIGTEKKDLDQFTRLVTPLGVAFAEACRPPAPKPKS